MRKVLVLGGGESGRGVARLAQWLGDEVFVSDAGPLSEAAREELESWGIDYEQGGHASDVLDGVDIVVKSPGIPWMAAVVASAKTKGILVQGEMEFCAPSVRGKVIGITGSNGKTTTTLLLGHLLHEAGMDVGVGGNVGKSFARMIAEDGERGRAWYVLELSSFQLENIERFRVDIGMVLNLSPDHLDRYEGNFDAYAAAKYRLKQTQLPGDIWLQATDPLSLKHAPAAQRGVTVIELPAEFDNNVARAEQHTYNLSDTVLNGPHNAANASFALTAAELAGADQPVLAKALTSFRNAPHRLETIGYVAGARYVNDSKATNPDAVDKALRSFVSPIVWIVGGQDKGNDYTLLEDLVRDRVKAIVAMGVDNSKLREAFADHPGGFADTNTLTDALSAARSFAADGDIVLLSPACASFDLFANYIDRGNRFRTRVEGMTGYSETL